MTNLQEFRSFLPRRYVLITLTALPEPLAPPGRGDEAHTDPGVADLLLHPGVDLFLGPLLDLPQMQEPALPIPIR